MTIYIRLKSKPNSVRIRFLSCQIFVLPSTGFDGYHMWTRNCLQFRSTIVHPWFSVGCMMLGLQFSFVDGCLFWPLHCLFFDLRLLVTSLISTNVLETGAHGILEVPNLSCKRTSTYECGSTYIY